MQKESGNGAQSANGGEVSGAAGGGRTQSAEPFMAEAQVSDADAVGERQAISDDEVEEIGHLGNEDDDPEGWMSERVDYWESLPPAVPPTREAWLRSVIGSATQQLAALKTKKAASWPTRDANLSWTNLANDALGLSRLPTGPATNPIQVKQKPDDGEEPESEMALA